MVYPLPCGKVWLSSVVCMKCVCAKLDNKEKKQNFGGWVKTPVLFVAVSRLMFMKFWDNVGDPSWFPMPFFVLYNCHVPHQIYWPSNLPLSCEVLENRCAVFVGQRTQNVLRQFVTVVYPYRRYRAAKFGWVLWSKVRVRSPAIKNNAEFSEGGWKLRSSFKPFVNQSSCRFECKEVDPPGETGELSEAVMDSEKVQLTRMESCLQRTCPTVYIMFHFVKLAESPKNVVLGPRFVGEGILQILDMFLNRTYFRAYGRFWLSSVQRARRLEGETKIDIDR